MNFRKFSRTFLRRNWQGWLIFMIKDKTENKRYNILRLSEFIFAEKKSVFIFIIFYIWFWISCLPIKFSSALMRFGLLTSCQYNFFVIIINNLLKIISFGHKIIVQLIAYDILHVVFKGFQLNRVVWSLI